MIHRSKPMASIKEGAIAVLTAGKIRLAIRSMAVIQRLGGPMA